MCASSLKVLAKSYNPWAKGYYSDASGLIGLKTYPDRGIVWLQADLKLGYVETGSTLTSEGAEYILFKTLGQ